MSNLKTQIKELASSYFSEVVEIRKHFHKYPELSFEEEKTAAFVCNKLDEIGIPYKRGYAKHGVVGKIEGNNPDKKVIALRADMDALPIVEQNDCDFKSVNEGVMHACGHDVHTASLLGTAKILNRLKDEFEGTVLLIFQPGEEKLPGGAKQMMEEGALDDPKPELIIGQHVYPEMEAGKVGLKPGTYMASTDEIYITAIGKGGHAALRDKLVDPIIIASEIILELHKKIPNQNLENIPTVFSIGKVEAKGATNVIPDKVEMEGTFRAMNEEWRFKVHEIIESTSHEIAKKYGGSVDVNIKVGYPVLENNEELTYSAIKSAEEFLGAENVEKLDIRMTAEDFAYYSQQYPSAFYRLGVRSTDSQKILPLHTSSFNIDDEALRTGMGTMAYIALSVLRIR